MTEVIKFICSACGNEHESWPAIAYDAPVYFIELSEEDRQNFCEINSDFCVISHADRTDRFIRCTLRQKVISECEWLDYGIWVSLSENSFNDYKQNFDNDNHEVQYFGWLSNNIESYENTTSVPTTVITRSGNQRPEVFPHEDFNHPFVQDYYNGITKQEAERRIRVAISPTILNGD